MKHAVQIAGKVIAQVCAPYPVNGQVLQVTASIGIAIYPENGQDYDALVQNADAAMLRVKHDGRNKITGLPPTRRRIAATGVRR